MAVINRSLGLAALGWWLAARGLSEPIEDSFTRLEPTGIQRLGKASRIAALVATRRLTRALREDPAYAAAQAELFSGDLVPTPWIDRLDALLNTPRVGLKLEKALVGDAEDFEVLMEIELAEDRAVMLAARLAEWLHSQLGAEDEPSAVATFLAQGWPIAEGAERRVTFLAEFLANLHTELADAPAEVTMPLGDPTEFREWLEKESGERTALPAEPAAPSLESAPPFVEETSAATNEPSIHEGDSEVVYDTLPETSVSTRVPEKESRSFPPQAPRRSRMGFWAFLFQLGWVALFIFGFRALQQRHGPMGAAAKPKATSTPAVATATLPPRATPAAPTPAPTPADEKPRPALALAPPTPGALAQKSELTLLPDELWPKAQELVAAGHHAEAVGVLRRITQIQAQDRSTGRLPRALVFARLAASLSSLERWDEADAVVERAQALLEELLPAQDPETALGLEMVADYWASRERWPLAARLYQKAIQTYEGTAAENSAQELSVINRFAGALRQIGDVRRAEQLYRQLVKGFEGMGDVAAVDAASASHNLANVLLTTNRAGEARTFYEKALGLIAKAPATDVEATRISIIMRANYERCLTSMGLSKDEAREKAQKPVVATAR